MNTSNNLLCSFNVHHFFHAGKNLSRVTVRNIASSLSSFIAMIKFGFVVLPFL